jgi:hypothetical protein
VTRTNYEADAKACARHRLPNPEVLAALSQGGAVDGQSRVLKVGCGTGNHIIAPAPDFACEAHGLEPANEIRAVAQSRDDAVIFHAGSAQNLAAVGDRNTYFAGAARALKPGGRIATVTDSENIIRGHMPLAE